MYQMKHIFLFVRSFRLVCEIEGFAAFNYFLIPVFFLFDYFNLFLMILSKRLASNLVWRAIAVGYSYSAAS